MTIWYVGETLAETWPVTGCATVQEAAKAKDLRVWRLFEADSAEEAWKRWGYIVKYAKTAVEAESRYMAQQRGRKGGTAGVGVAKIRAGFAESLRRARAVRAARILAKSSAEQHHECQRCRGVGTIHSFTTGRTRTCECCNGSGRADS